jgi:hypothetical protein
VHRQQASSRRPIRDYSEVIKKWMAWRWGEKHLGAVLFCHVTKEVVVVHHDAARARRVPRKHAARGLLVEGHPTRIHVHR